MRLLLLITLPLMLITSSAYSQEVFTQVVNSHAGMFDIKEVEIRRISVENVDFQNVFKDYKNDCSDVGRERDSDGNIVRLTDAEGISLEQITNMGKEAWAFIQSNKPVVNATTQYAHALPRGSVCWDDLSNWQRPKSEYYETVYKNGFGFEVVRLEFRLVYAYGGQVNNKGRYISNATIQYSELDVSWGFKVNAAVEVPLVINTGTKEDPVAGMQISVRWSVDSVNHTERTASFFIYGDGRPTDVL